MKHEEDDLSDFGSSVEITEEWAFIYLGRQEMPEIALWREVLIRAIRDLVDPSLGLAPYEVTRETTISVSRQKALSWFLSKSEHAGSFRWICDVLWPDSNMRSKIIKKLTDGSVTRTNIRRTESHRAKKNDS